MKASVFKSVASLTLFLCVLCLSSAAVLAEVPENDFIPYSELSKEEKKALMESPVNIKPDVSGPQEHNKIKAAFTVTQG